MLRFAGWKASLGCAATILLMAGKSHAVFLGQSFLVPVTYPTDHAFDAESGILYITPDSGGTLQRYSLRDRQSLTSWPIPYPQPQAMDLSRDGRYLYTSGYPGSTGPTKTITRIELGSGTQTPFVSPASAGASIYDLTCTADGSVFFTNANIDYLRQLNPETGVVIPRTDAPRGFFNRLSDRTLIYPSGDRTTFMVCEGNISTATMFTYNVTTDTFSPGIGFEGQPWAALNRDGTLVAIGGQIRDRNLQPIGLVSDTALAFDPTRDVLYSWSSSRASIVARDTNTWEELFSFPTVSSQYRWCPNVASVSSDGQYLFVAVDNGIRVFGVPEPTAAGLMAAAMLMVMRRRRP